MKKSFRKTLNILSTVIGIYGSTSLLTNSISYSLQLKRLDEIKNKFGLEEAVKDAHWEIDFHETHKLNEYAPILFFLGHIGDVMACQSFIRQYVSEYK